MDSLPAELRPLVIPGVIGLSLGACAGMLSIIAARFGMHPFYHMLPSSRSYVVCCSVTTLAGGGAGILTHTFYPYIRSGFSDVPFLSSPPFYPRGRWFPEPDHFENQPNELDAPYVTPPRAPQNYGVPPPVSPPPPPSSGVVHPISYSPIPRAQPPQNNSGYCQTGQPLIPPPWQTPYAQLPSQGTSYATPPRVGGVYTSPPSTPPGAPPNSLGASGTLNQKAFHGFGSFPVTAVSYGGPPSSSRNTHSADSNGVTDTLVNKTNRWFSSISTNTGTPPPLQF